MTPPPIVKFRRNEPLQDEYDAGDGTHYSVAALLDDAKDLPVFDCPLAAIDLSSCLWKNHTMSDLAFHIRRVMRSDLQVPILLDWEGGVADGRHRILKALVLGRRTIKARRMQWKPIPCRVDKDS